jgi:hypothetical protein
MSEPNIALERVDVHGCGQRWQAVITDDGGSLALRAHLSASRGNTWVWWESSVNVNGDTLSVKMDEREVPADLADRLNALVSPTNQGSVEDRLARVEAHLGLV